MRERTAFYSVKRRAASLIENGREWGAAGMAEYLKHKTVTSATPGYSWDAYGSSG